MATIHSTAVVDAKAELAEGVEVGPYAIIGANVKIGEGTIVQAHAFLSGHTTIGKKCEIFPFACVGMKSQDLKYQEGDITFVEIGDNTVLREFSTVHLGTRPGEVTKVGNRCLIMAYCHIAHGCNVGNDVIMSNLATLAGEVVLEVDGPPDMDVATLETTVKYEGYLKREEAAAARLRREERRRIPEEFAYAGLAGLTHEVVQRLTEVRPETLGQACRVPGVTPAAVAVLGMHIERYYRQRAGALEAGRVALPGAEAGR